MENAHPCQTFRIGGPNWRDGKSTTVRIIQKTFLTQRSESPLSGEHGSGWSRKDTPAGDFLPQIATCAARPVSKLLGDDLLAKTRMSNRKPTKFVIAQSSSPNNLPRGTIQTKSQSFLVKQGKERSSTIVKKRVSYLSLRSCLSAQLWRS